jgi:hypothetical protein
MLPRDRINALAVLALGGLDRQSHLLAESGAGHIMPIFRNPSRFTIGGSVCSGRVFVSCAECAVKTATAWFVSRRKEMLSPSPLG